MNESVEWEILGAWILIWLELGSTLGLASLSDMRGQSAVEMAKQFNRKTVANAPRKY